MTRFLSLAAGISIIILSSACSQLAREERQNPHVPPTASPIKDLGTDEWPIGARKVLFAGTFNRKTKILQISRGLPEPRTFENLDTGLKSLEEAGYKRLGLLRLRDILENENEQEMGAYPAVEKLLDPSDVLSAFEVMGGVVRFTIFDIDLSKYPRAVNVADAVEQNRSQAGCERISKSCIKCPNGKIYCVIEKVKRIGDR